MSRTASTKELAGEIRLSNNVCGLVLARACVGGMDHSGLLHAGNLFQLRKPE